MSPRGRRGSPACKRLMAAWLSGAVSALTALCSGCASSPLALATPAEARPVTGCRFEPAHDEEIWRCMPNPATASRLLCGYRKERVPDRWWLEYERGKPLEVDRETCEVEGEREGWECQTADGFVFLDEAPSQCP